jgi:molybdate transport system substrate-binding protein
MKIQILSGGAAQGLVATLAAQFGSATGCEIDGTFDAVGAMRDKLVAGAPADLVILTQALIAELARAGHIAEGSALDIGVVLTGVAVRAGDPQPAIGNPAAVREALRAADAVYFPDPKLATAGIHFAKVVDMLGLRAELAGRLRPFPNGSTAMRELAAAKSARPIGCTQVTEILATPGAELVGPLPKELELATVYAAGVCAKAAQAALARQFVAMLTDDASRDLRRRLGFHC